MKGTSASRHADDSIPVATPADIETAIENELAVRWGPIRRHPELTAFRHAGDPSAWRDMRLTIELEHDLELPFEIDDVEVLEMLQGGAEGFARTLAEVCEGLRKHGADLRASQEAMRARCEAFSCSLEDTGLKLPFAWISLAPYDHWIDPRAVRFDIALEGLGDHLRPADVLGEAGIEDNLHEVFEYVLDVQRDRARLREQIRAQRADGLADALALAVIRLQPDPIATLGAAMREDRVELPDGLSLHWAGGVLRSRGDCAGNAEWWRDQIELPGRWFSAPAIAGLVDGPASAVLDHPALVGIPIRAIHSEIADGRPSSMVSLDLSIELFEASTSRSWPWPHPGAG